MVNLKVTRDLNKNMRKLILPFIVLIIIILLSTISCGPYIKKPAISHVLAVTTEGDTILVAIDKIRPNMYYSYYPVYSSYRPNYYNNQYYGYNNYKFRYPDNRGVSNNKNYRTPPPKEVGGTTYSNNHSNKTISRIDYDKAADRGAAGKPRK